MSKFSCLIGSRINKIFLNQDQSELAFQTEHCIFAFHTDADCCSETWFADINGVSALLDGYVVTNVEEYQLPDDPQDGRSRQECDYVMGVKIKTFRGVCTIEYRNSSNGYYGGSVDYVYTPESLDGWQEITSDWQA